MQLTAFLEISLPLRTSVNRASADLESERVYTRGSVVALIVGRPIVSCLSILYSVCVCISLRWCKSELIP